MERKTCRLSIKYQVEIEWPAREQHARDRLLVSMRYIYLPQSPAIIDESLRNSRMAIRLPGVIMQAKTILRRSNKASSDVPKGYLAVYIGEAEKKRFVIPISFLNEPSFQELLCKAEEEFGFQHPMGGLTIPCSEDMFINMTSQ
ncbi:hypothetical protein ACFE04_027900 [Oxalis oulophora]